MKETILFIAYSEWSDWRGDNDLYLSFAGNHLVVFVEVMPRYDCFTIKGLKSFIERFFIIQPFRINDNLIVFPSVSMLPFALPKLSKIWRKKIAELSIKLSKKLQILFIKKQLKALGIQPTILIVSEPFDFYLVGEFCEKISCYRVYDEITNFYSNAFISDLIGDIEKSNIHRVNMVFASSKAQYENRKSIHPNVFLIPNAANFTHFNKASKDKLPRPTDLKDISSPIIGFVGTFDFRIDLKLIESVARSKPEWSIVVVGPIREYSMEDWRKGIRRLNKLENIHFLGARDFKHLPDYMKYFDVCMIPFLVNDVTNTMYPCKLHEYLATGSPVVSTDLHELKPFQEIVPLAESKNEFIKMIEEELQTDSPLRLKERINVALQNSWSIRSEQILRLIKKNQSDKLQGLK
ncbi:glycosyltransferase [Thermodesulfobacteriota bacterium]